MTVREFHSGKRRKIHYNETESPMHTVADFYDEFLVKSGRLPEKDVVLEWHKVLTKYASDPESKIFLVRKYECTKENGEWNNRRGAVIRFADGFEIVYASNFLAHEIYLMACYGVVPTYEEFKELIEKRELPITCGTAVERLISLYPSANKTCGCYLAHIMSVNGLYIRENGNCLEISSDETSNMYPLGTPENWVSSPDKINHIPYSLNDEEKELVKAHFLRFLDPMNHYVTPETKHCVHTLADWPKRKNIGEYPYLTHYVTEQYKSRFGAEYDTFTALARFREKVPEGYTGTNLIGLEICKSLPEDEADETAVTEKAPIPKKRGSDSKRSPFPRNGIITEYIPSNMDEFKSLFIKRGLARITVTYKDGHTETKDWPCRKITQKTNIKGNVTSKSWYTKGKDRISKIVCEVI